MILDHIEKARRLGLPHVYLGYWVEGSKKMAYKGRYLPQERLGVDGWKRIERKPPALSAGSGSRTASCARGAGARRTPSAR